MLKRRRADHEKAALDRVRRAIIDDSTVVRARYANAIREDQLPAEGDAADDEWWCEYGDFIERTALGKYNPEELRRLAEGLDPGPGSILDDLDWTRGER